VVVETQFVAAIRTNTGDGKVPAIRTLTDRRPNGKIQSDNIH
jgi:hypothetical protein